MELGKLQSMRDFTVTYKWQLFPWSQYSTEYDVVIISGAEKGSLPSPACQNLADVQQDKTLFHLCMLCARKRLYLCFLQEHGLTSFLDEVYNLLLFRRNLREWYVQYVHILSCQIKVFSIKAAYWFSQWPAKRWYRTIARCERATDVKDLWLKMGKPSLSYRFRWFTENDTSIFIIRGTLDRMRALRCVRLVQSGEKSRNEVPEY